MAAGKNLATIIAAGTAAVPGTPVIGTAVDLTTKYGAFITGLLTNGATGPTIAPSIYVEVSGDNINWKEVWRGAGDTSANSVTPFSYEVCWPVMYARVRVAGNTGQNVACEAFAHVLASI